MNLEYTHKQTYEHINIEHTNIQTYKYIYTNSKDPKTFSKDPKTFCYKICTFYPNELKD